MKRKEMKVYLTETDEERFTFHQVKDTDLQGKVANLRRTFITITALLAVVTIVCIILAARPFTNIVRICFGALAAVFGYLIFSNYDLYRTNVRSFTRRSEYITVQIIEKLPIEEETITTRGIEKKKEKYLFFPVRVRDTSRKNYTSVCYLTKEEYEECKKGDTRDIYIHEDWRRKKE